MANLVEFKDESKLTAADVYDATQSKAQDTINAAVASQLGCAFFRGLTDSNALLSFHKNTSATLYLTYTSWTRVSLLIFHLGGIAAYQGVRNKDGTLSILAGDGTFVSCSRSGDVVTFTFTYSAHIIVFGTWWEGCLTLS